MKKNIEKFIAFSIALIITVIAWPFKKVLSIIMPGVLRSARVLDENTYFNIKSDIEKATSMNSLFTPEDEKDFNKKLTVRRVLLNLENHGYLSLNRETLEIKVLKELPELLPEAIANT